MYLADDLWRRKGIRNSTDITFASGGTMIFAVPGFKETLLRIVADRSIRTTFFHDLIAVHSEEKQAVFRVTSENGVSEEVLPYDLLHVTPPMKAPDFISSGPLAHQDGLLKGWMNVDMYTLQHPEYPNVFSLGDVAGLPTAKTGAGVRKQAPVVVHNLLEVLAGRVLDERAAKYNGYCSCPIMTGYGKLVLAEFGYDNVPMPSFPFDQTKERYSMWLLKKYGLPFLYWNLMLKGKA
jgi:sulfide:quinone oxidoreductase